MVTVFYSNEWIGTFSRNALISSVSALYCAAFIGKGQEILLAFLPSFMFFISLIICYLIEGGIPEILQYMFIHPLLLLILPVFVFPAWAALLIFFSHIIYKFINRLEITNKFAL